MGKLFQAVWCVEDDWQDKATREAIGEHNLKVHSLWLAVGGDPARKFCWHVTEITLDHLWPSPQWKRAMEELQFAKGCETAIRRGLKELAERRRRRRKSIGCFGRHSKRWPLALSFHPRSNGQTTSPCHRRQRGEPDISKKPSRPKGNTGLNDFQTFSVSMGFRHGWRMVRALWGGPSGGHGEKLGVAD